MSSDLLSRLQAAVGEAYRIEKELGGGGMSRVFLAEEIRLGRRVVIKVLPPEMSAGVNVERFEREIQLSANLQHPHIVPLLTAGASGDLLYYVMPFIKGESLRAKLAREGELPIGEAVRILREVADALAYAHAEGVVHRDIKPDNVLLSGQHAVVTDFGVAKAVSASTGASSLTSLGVALGTPAYMAPEQAVADPNTDHRADIYALGALAYEMLTGRPPFVGSNPQAVLSAHVTEAPTPVTKHRETVPPALNEVIMRCLAKKAADRWQKAEDVRSQFESMSTPTGGMTPTGTQPVAAVTVSDAARAYAQAHPGRVAGLFLASSLVVLFVVYAIVQLAGLPDWVFWGAIGLLGVGLPIMLLAGKHERRRAEAALTGTQVPTPTGVQRHFTWRRAILGGGIAFAGLAVVAGGYMAMRALGIGPVGTLVATGALDQRGLLIVAEFADRTPEGNIAPSATEALRVDLSQSRVLRLMDAAAIREALTRMNRPDTLRVEGAVAREIAQREGVKAIVEGEVGVLGTGYVVTARLVSAADERELLALRETAADAGALIPAVDRLSKKLRERIGESLKTIRASEPLERVTTTSLEALRLYTRAEEVDGRGDSEQAIRLLEQAVAVDTGFAMAYRKLGVILGNTAREPSRIQAALTKAFELRHRLPPLEREVANAYYYSNVQFDRDRTIDAYRAALAIDPEASAPLNNLGLTFGNSRRYAEAEEMYRRRLAIGPLYQSYIGLARALATQGRLEAADSTVRAFETALPGHPQATELRVHLATVRRNYPAADSLARALPEDGRIQSLALLSQLPEVRGRLKASAELARRFLADAERKGNRLDVLRWALWPVRQELRYGDPQAALRSLERTLANYPLSSVSPADRPYLAVARVYAAVGRTTEVERLHREWESAATRPPWERAEFDALAATAAGRHDVAIAAFRVANREHPLANAHLADLAHAYDLAGQSDSALAVYDRVVATPELLKFISEFDRLGPTYKRMGELYEERGDREKALDSYGKFVDLWKDADPELQPVVREVRQRMARLAGEGR